MSTLLKSLHVSSLVAAMALVASGLTGCKDDAYCFVDCDQAVTGGAGGGSGGDLSTGGNLFNTGGMNAGGGVGGGQCELTNAGVEICDTIDNDCDGEVDEETDFNSILTCGTCDNSCFSTLLNADPATIACDWDGTPGNPGSCSFTDCAGDFFDVDGDGVDCEYFCVQTSTDDAECNNRDDDCDGIKDEDVDLCGDVDNCGQCGRRCVVAHGTGQCVDTGVMPCTPANTNCEIAACDDDDNDGDPDWWDVDLDYTNGCEYNCSLNDATGGLEVCGNGIDDDCDGDIDAADSDLSGDPNIGATCYGGEDQPNPTVAAVGLCADPMHAGTWGCVGQEYVCQGANVLFPGDMTEVCNLDAMNNPIDDDCNGVANDVDPATLSACGMSNIFPCQLGQEQCVGGVITCVGNIDPQDDICDGLNNDCDVAGIDDHAGTGLAFDEGGACNTWPPPPAGATSPCSPGTLTCTGGVLGCTGGDGPTDTVDGCNDDSNCDGVLSNQPDTDTDTANCGMCGNNCYAGTLHKVFTCVGGACQDQGCEAGWWDISVANGGDGNPDTCEYGPCIQTGPELCDDRDNDCNGLVDDIAAPPSPADAGCGVSALASRPECTSLVTVACNSAAKQWECTFPAGVCDGPGGCATTPEICDTLDNNCNGSFNENVPGFGLPCKSDDGLPFPGHGACQTSGTFVCDGPTATQCSAVKEDCVNLAAGCEELCDGKDNDCDGSVDEVYLQKNDVGVNGEPADPAYFVMPAVTQLDMAPDELWITTYEVSRPDADATTAGDGNGYHCGSGCGPLPDAPSGTPLDGTIGCSVPDRLPWFNVTPVEVEQTCDAIGGFICDVGDWQLSCEAQAAMGCFWGYNPTGSCRTNADAMTYCNLAAFDFNTTLNGIQDGLLPGGSPLLANCSADWSGTFGNDLGEPQIFDITGNLREITKMSAGIYPLMGGAFNTQDEEGATCTFDFYVVEEDFALLDTGFRCCFDTDPTM